MMGGRKFFVTVVAIFSLLFMSLPVNAGYYYGGVGSITGGSANEYGITDTTKVTLTFDALAGEVKVDFSGLVSFDEGDAPLEPTIIKDDASGWLQQLRFGTDNIAAGGPYGKLNIDTGLASSGPHENLDYFLTGSGWDITGTLSYNEIPIPGAIWLLGFGMIGLAGIRRRFGTSE